MTNPRPWPRLVRLHRLRRAHGLRRSAACSIGSSCGEPMRGGDAIRFGDATDCREPVGCNDPIGCGRILRARCARARIARAIVHGLGRCSLMLVQMQQHDCPKSAMRSPPPPPQPRRPSSSPASTPWRRGWRGRGPRSWTRTATPRPGAGLPETACRAPAWTARTARRPLSAAVVRHARCLRRIMCGACAHPFCLCARPEPAACAGMCINRRSAGIPEASGMHKRLSPPTQLVQDESLAVQSWAAS